MQQQQFAATQQERQTKELVNRAASQYAIGNTDVISIGFVRELAANGLCEARIGGLVLWRATGTDHPA